MGKHAKKYLIFFVLHLSQALCVFVRFLRSAAWRCLDEAEGVIWV